MEEGRSQVCENILNLTLEIICLLTGERCAVVKMASIEGLLQGLYPHLSWPPSGIHTPVIAPPLNPKKNNERKILESINQVIELLTGEKEIPSDGNVAVKTETTQQGDAPEEAEPCRTAMTEGHPTGRSRKRKPRPFFRDSAQEELSHYTDEVGGGAEQKEAGVSAVLRSAEEFGVMVTIKEEDSFTLAEPDLSYDRNTSEETLSFSLECRTDDDNPAERSSEEGPAAYNSRPGPPAAPSTCPGRPFASSIYPGCTAAPNIASGLTIASNIHPGLITSPGLTTAPNSGPGLTSASSILPGLTTAPNSGPGLTSASSIHPGLTSASSILPGLTSASNTGSGRTDAPSIHLFPASVGWSPDPLIPVGPQCAAEEGAQPLSVCSTCGKCFTSKSAYNNHRRVHSDSRPYSCPQCGKCFKQKAHLVTHEMCHARARLLSCSECGKSFKNKARFAVHQRYHAGEKIFTCSECGKEYPTKSKLNRHLKQHTAEKPFACTECDYRGWFHSDLVLHIRTHTGEKPFVCPSCGKGFQRKFLLHKHQTKKH